MKITDFGISKDLFQPFGQSFIQSQTAHPQFIPPELLLNGYSNERSDLYHLGLILLYLYTGWLPSINIEDVKDGIPRQRAKLIGNPLGDFIAVLLRRSNEYRFTSAIDAWDALKTIN